MCITLQVTDVRHITQNSYWVCNSP